MDKKKVIKLIVIAIVSYLAFVATGVAVAIFKD